MPEWNSRSLRRFGPVGALGIAGVACLAGLAPVASAADAPAPDPPPLAVAPDPVPAKQPTVKQPVTPARPRETPVVTRAPVVAQSVTPAPVATETPARPVQKSTPAVVRRERPARKQPVAKKSKPVASPSWVLSPWHTASREAWLTPRATIAVPADPLQRGRFALAGVVLALVAVGGGVLVGVGGRTLKEGLA